MSARCPLYPRKRTLEPTCVSPSTQRLRQIGDIRRDPPCLIGGYQGHSAGTHRKVAWGKRSLERDPSNASCPCLYCLFIVAVGLYVLGMIVLALTAILGSVRRNRGIEKTPPHSLASPPRLMLAQ